MLLVEEMFILADDRSLLEIRTRLAWSILAAVVAVTMCTSAIADVALEPMRRPPPPPQPAELVKTGYKVTDRKSVV